MKSTEFQDFSEIHSGKKAKSTQRGRKVGDLRPDLKQVEIQAHHQVGSFDMKDQKYSTCSN